MYELNTAAGKLTVLGDGFTIDALPALKSATLDWSVSAVSELRLEFEDSRGELLRSGKITCGTKAGAKGTLVTIGTRAFEVRSMEHSADGTLVLEARSGKVAAMKRSERGTGAETVANISPTKWIARAAAWYGLNCMAQDTPVREQITRQGADGTKTAETDWDVVQRLAKEEGFLAFEVDNTIWFGKPSWLINVPGRNKLVVEMKDTPAGPTPVDPNIFTRPAPRRSSDSDDAVATWSVNVNAKWAMQLGAVGFGATLTGYAAQFDGSYLVTKVSFPLDDQGTGQLDAATPVDPVPQPPQAAATANVGTTSGTMSSPGAGRYGNVNLSAEQVQNATTIAKVGQQMGVGSRGMVVAIATALQESTLRNLNYGDRDSLGLFQQRPSMGWGTPAQIQDPAYAARKFYEALLKVSGWQNMAVTVAAQRVQRSGFADAYAKWEGTATALVNAILATAAVKANPQTVATSSKEKAIVFARAQIGKMYQWGGTGNPSYDCSGLVQAAYAAAGYKLLRTTYQMLDDKRLTPVSLAALQPGDLWFPHTGHVQLISVGGAGNSTIIEAPTSGVAIRECKIWGTGAGSQGRRVPL